MTIKTEEFIQLINKALEISEKEHLSNVINALQSIKTKTFTGTLEPSAGTLTLGLAREVADWTESLDSSLLHSLGAIEKYYQENL